jgi:hypothetical protein
MDNSKSNHDQSEPSKSEPIEFVIDPHNTTFNYYDSIFDILINEKEEFIDEQTNNDLLITPYDDDIFCNKNYQVGLELGPSNDRDFMGLGIGYNFMNSVTFQKGDKFINHDKNICYYNNCEVIPYKKDIKCSLCEIVSCHKHIYFCKLCKFGVCMSCHKENLCLLCVKTLKFQKLDVALINFCFICQKIFKEKKSDFIFLDKFNDKSKRLCCASCYASCITSNNITKKDIKNFTSNYIIYYTNETKPIYTKIYLNIFPKDLVNLILMYFRHFRE